ncbi:MAG: 3-phosphoshikimate 1-carboxyvinyltransferase [Synergistaceae bacterium]|jgi:3-phosphoshikimate 1-carboxyvinyltransferase|nr:3-phosphoshikimate 1-carboxyvinyltransferase [Synergistaceae bacterium]
MDVRVIERFPRGVVTPPPSKSLSHRAVICSALAGGGSVIENLGVSDDIEATLAGIRALGLANARREGSVLRVDSSSGTRRASPDEVRVVDCNESGSTLRFLLPIAALDGSTTSFVGRGRLMSRPLDVYAKFFAEAGASFVQEPDRITVRGPFRSGEYEMRGDVSSQFVSGLILALPLLEGDSVIRLVTPLESRRYVDLTIDVARRFGAEVLEGDSCYAVRGGRRYRPARYQVEPDYSQAAFFLASAALGRDVEVEGLDPDSLQGDRDILRILGEMGAVVDWRAGPRGGGWRTSVRAGRLSAVTVDARDIPDLVPPVAALCCFCEGTSRIEGALRLRLKESDRLSALRTELNKLGADVEETRDSLAIRGAGRLAGGRVDAWGDHRIAMSLAVAAIGCDGPVLMSGWRSVSKSYPDFWRDFEGGNP